jgi:hypothetical protein
VTPKNDNNSVARTRRNHNVSKSARSILVNYSLTEYVGSATQRQAFQTVYSVLFRLSTKSLCKFIISAMHATCPAHLAALDFIIFILSDETYKLGSSPVSHSLLNSFFTRTQNREKLVLVNRLPTTPRSFCVSLPSLRVMQYPHNYTAVGLRVRV